MEQFQTHHIDLNNKCDYPGCFWKVTNSTFDTILPKENVHNLISWKHSGGYFSLSTYKNNRVIYGELGKYSKHCVNFILRKNKYYECLELYINELKTDCSYKFVTDKSKTRELLELLDVIAMLFGAKRITLRDDAYYQDIKEIDFSLLTVMKEGKLFYEKYGYAICNSNTEDVRAIDINIHTKLLKEFRFDVFLTYLAPAEIKFIQKILNKLNNSYKYLGDFYTDSFKYLKSTKHFLYIQNIITNKKYPWYSMVYAIQTSKYCMEKFPQFDL